MAQRSVSGTFDPPTQFLEGLQINVDASPGEIAVEWTVYSFTEDELINEQTSGVAAPSFFGRPLEEAIKFNMPDRYSVTVSLGANRLGSIQREAQNRIDSITSQVDIPTQLITDRVEGISSSFNVPSVTETTEVSVGGQGEGSRTLNFTPMQIPVPEGESIIDEIPRTNWPQLKITVEGSAPGTGTSILVFSSEQKSYNMSIPPEAFIREVTIGEDLFEGPLNCATEFPDIDSVISRLESNIGVGTSSPTLSLPLSIDRFRDLRSDITEAQQQVQEELTEDTPCLDELLSRLDRARSELQNLQRQDAPVLGCADINTSIRTDASSVEGAVEQFVSRDRLARIPDDKEDLQQEADEVIGEIEREVSDENPCKRELLARVRDARQRILRVPVRTEADLPCGERFQELGRQLDTFEDQVLSLSPPAEPGTIQEVAQSGDGIISEIENRVPSDDPCRQEMADRVTDLVSRVESLATQVRIETEAPDEGQERREELVQQLLSSIDRLQSTTDREVGADVDQQLT